MEPAWFANSRSTNDANIRAMKSPKKRRLTWPKLRSVEYARSADCKSPMDDPKSDPPC